jgi:hypothetical protein
LRQVHRFRRLAAIMGASAQIEGSLRATGNSKDVSVSDPGVQMPCRI